MRRRCFDLNQVFTERKILLVPLSRGLLGPEAASLVGSLLVAQLWQTTLARAAVPAERRHPVMVYIDEVQDYLHLPTDHFPGRFACDRYAAALRSTSFSCSSSRLRRFNSRSSTDSELDTPARRPSSTSALVSQFRKHDSLIPKSFAISAMAPRPYGRPQPRRRGTLLGWGLGTINILPAAPSGTTDQMSPIRAAVPQPRIYDVISSAELDGTDYQEHGLQIDQATFVGTETERVLCGMHDDLTSWPCKKSPPSLKD